MGFYYENGKYLFSGICIHVEGSGINAGSALDKIINFYRTNMGLKYLF